MGDFERIKTTRAEATSWSMPDVMVPSYMVAMSALADATKLNEIRLAAKGRGEVVPSYTALVIKAAAVVLSRHPQANRAILGPPLFRRLIQFNSTNISVAVERNLPELPGHAFAGTVINALEKSLNEITNELRFWSTCSEGDDARMRLFMRILKWVPRPLSTWLINAPYWSASLWSQHRGCACWVNAPTKAGADLVVTTWPWPITFSFGVVKERPFVLNGQVISQLTIPLLMSFDRRIQGGGPASRLFAEYKKIIEQGELMDGNELTKS